MNEDESNAMRLQSAASVDIFVRTLSLLFSVTELAEQNLAMKRSASEK